MDLGDVNTPDAWASLRGGDMRFRAIIQLSGKTSTGISVPSEVVEGLGSGKRPPVRVTINGHSYRSTVAPMGGEFCPYRTQADLPTHSPIRLATFIRAGPCCQVGTVKFI